MPLFSHDSTGEGNEKEDKKKDDGPKVITKTIVLPDGSYGTETIVVKDPAQAKLLDKDS